MERLGQLAEKGGALSETGEIEAPRTSSARTRGWKGVYGFSVQVGQRGGRGDGVRIEPFGNIRKDQKTGEAVVQEVREPLTDVFEEKEGVLVVAEMPGVGAADIKLMVAEDVLTLSAATADKRYQKEVLLPRPFRSDQATLRCNNGLVEIWLKDSAPAS